MNDMSLEDRIKEELVTDTATVLEAHLDDVKGFLEIHQDGTVVIANDYREIDAENQILIYLIGQRYAHEADLADSDTLSTNFFYEKFDASDRTVRNWLQSLRETGLASKKKQSEHRIVVENIPDTIKRIENNEE